MLVTKGRVWLLLFFLLLPPFRNACGQENYEEADPVSLVGLTLGELIGRFGAPKAVYPARGPEEWQDDVVFVYERGDFYVYRDRVWQVALKAAMGITIGDSRSVAFLVLGSKAETRGNSIFCSLNERAWPLVIRCDFDSAGKIGAIFIYRSDF